MHTRIKYLIQPRRSWKWNFLGTDQSISIISYYKVELQLLPKHENKIYHGVDYSKINSRNISFRFYRKSQFIGDHMIGQIENEFVKV